MGLNMIMIAQFFSQQIGQCSAEQMTTPKLQLFFTYAPAGINIGINTGSKDPTRLV
jgi:hypothetical protein